MDKQTTDALHKSIAHWKENEAITDIKGARISPSDCALCKLFFNDHCRGCPVNDAGYHECCGSPHTEAFNAVCDGDLKAFKRAARKEVQFLDGLIDGAPEQDRLSYYAFAVAVALLSVGLLGWWLL